MFLFFFLIWLVTCRRWRYHFGHASPYSVVGGCLGSLRFQRMVAKGTMVGNDFDLTGVKGPK